jgi:hypothetical protein
MLPLVIVYGVVFLAPVAALLLNLNSFPLLRGSTFSDLLISHYPNALFLQRTLASGGGIPWWSPQILSGAPFAANPLAGLFYLPGWLALLFPLPAGLNLSIALHLVLAGIGMYWFLRAEGLGNAPALLGAFLFESAPKIFSHLGAGHWSLIYAVAWTPWLLLMQRRVAAPCTQAQSAQGLASKRWIRWAARAAGPGAVLGLIGLADTRWAAYAGMLWLLYGLHLALSGPSEGRGKRARSWLVRGAFGVVIALLAAAPLLLPLFEYTRISTRALMTTSDNLLLSLPAQNLLGLVFPSIGGAAEWMVYPGGAALALALWTVANKPTRRAAGFWLVLIPLVMVIALGENTPVGGWLARLPGYSLLRVPPRVVFVASFAYASVAGYGLQGILSLRLATKERNGQPERDSGTLIVFGMAGFATLLAVGVWAGGASAMARLQFTWGALFLILAAAGVMLARRRSQRWVVAVLAVPALVDLLGVNLQGLAFYPSQSVIHSPAASAVQCLLQAAGPSPFRVYSPSYSIPQHVAALHQVELVDGVDPLHLGSYAEFVERASGVRRQGYSVTVPAFYRGDPTTDNRDARPDLYLLGLLNARFLASAFPLENGETSLARLPCSPVQQEGVGIYLYENPLSMERAWVQPADTPPGQGAQPVNTLRLSPNQITVSATGPGVLVLSEIDYPGWTVAVDGAPRPVSSTAGLLRSVILEAGAHTVVFKFAPWPVYAGLAIGAVVWGLLGLLAFARKFSF